MNQLSDTARPQQHSFAERTGQARRLRVTLWICQLGGLGGSIFLIVSLALGRFFDLGWVLSIFFAVSFVGLIGKWLAVRCPQCRTFVVWHLYKTVGITGFGEGMASDACPKCGYVPPSDNPS